MILRIKEHDLQAKGHTYIIRYIQLDGFNHKREEK